MKLNKDTITTIRKILKVSISKNKKTLSALEQTEDYARKISAPFYTFTRLQDMDKKKSNSIITLDEVINAINKISPLRFDKGTSLNEIFDQLLGNILVFRKNIQKQELLLKAIKEEGIRGTSYSLPLLILSCSYVNGTCGRLMAMGIKKNAESKTENDECMDKEECKLLEFERELANFITDDYHIDISRLDEFLDLFITYIETYFLSTSMTSNNPTSHEKNMTNIQMTMGFYALQAHFDMPLETGDLMNYYKSVHELVFHARISQSMAVRLICGYVIYIHEIVLKDKSLDLSKVYNGKGYYVESEEANTRFAEYLDTTTIEASLKEKILGYLDRPKFSFDEEIPSIAYAIAYNTYRLTKNVAYEAARKTLEKALDKERMESQKNLKQNVNSDNQREILAPYVENGRVVELCDADQFESLLEQSSLSENRKIELRLQMKNLQNATSREYRNQKMTDFRERYLTPRQKELYELASADPAKRSLCEDIDACISMLLDDENAENIGFVKDEIAIIYARIAYREKYLTPRQNELYSRAKSDPVATSTAKDIDACIDMLIEDESEQTIDSIKEEISDLCDLLNDLLGIEEVEEEKKQTSEVLYFPETLVVDGEPKRVPKLLVSLLKDKKTHYRQAYNILTRLLEGNTTGDREVQGTLLPCRLLSKGNDFKFFYTVLGNKIVIIDAAPKDADCFTNAIKIVHSEEFKNFLASVKKGTIAPTAEHTKAILDELAKSKKVTVSLKI